jgi:hypothetical protein
MDLEERATSEIGSSAKTQGRWRDAQRWARRDQNDPQRENLAGQLPIICAHESGCPPMLQRGVGDFAAHDNPDDSGWAMV